MYDFYFVTKLPNSPPSPEGALVASIDGSLLAPADLDLLPLKSDVRPLGNLLTSGPRAQTVEAFCAGGVTP